MHTPVLLQESLQGLNLKRGNVFVDATVNGGGHSEAVAKLFGQAVSIVGIDLDADAIAKSKDRLAMAGAHADLFCDSYVHMPEILKGLSISKADAVLFDFGLSSNQYESGRGFSFQKDEPLVMTFKSRPDERDVTALDVVNNWKQDSLQTIIKGFGEERYSGRIARAIAEAREISLIRTTAELRDIIVAAVPAAYRRGKIHPATRTFQALRIAVNGELDAISLGLRAAWDVLAPGGRIAAISFHSLEDRIVKRFFKDMSADNAAIITKKPIVPNDGEIAENPRSRSAKLRILEKKEL